MSIAETANLHFHGFRLPNRPTTHFFSKCPQQLTVVVCGPPLTYRYFSIFDYVIDEISMKSMNSLKKIGLLAINFSSDWSLWARCVYWRRSCRKFATFCLRSLSSLAFMYLASSLRSIKWESIRHHMRHVTNLRQFASMSDSRLSP